MEKKPICQQNNDLQKTPNEKESNNVNNVCRFFSYQSQLTMDDKYDIVSFNLRLSRDFGFAFG